MISISPDRLRDILVKEGLMNAETFEAIRKEAQRKKQPLENLLLSQGLIPKEYFYTVIAKFLGVERINLGNIKIDESVLRLLPEDIARRRKAIVFGITPDKKFQVAMEDPGDLETIDFLALRLGAPIVPYLATEEDLNRGFILYARQLSQDFKKIIEESVEASLRSKAKGDLVEAAAELPIVAIVDNFIGYALSSRASDIHFEALDDAILVRYRIDGVLHEIMRLPKEVHPAVVARIKILSGLRVDEHSKPQDGRFRYKIGENLVDIRVSIAPTFYGEKIELRLFSAAQKPLTLSELGFSDENISLIEAAIAKTYGMILACGPTGAGKTTTLYSILNLLNRPEVNIVTIEDPIEYDIRYINQIQVNPAAGITFATGLRSILRQDPNIIMVGEIRDAETANISVQAALTGHLLLSSLHTNDAPTAIPRLIDMGVPPFLVAAVLNDVIAQRLVRRIHIDCIESYTPDEVLIENIKSELKTLGMNPERIRLSKTFYRGKGCAACNHTGYFGRIGIFEILAVNERIRQLIISPEFNLDSLRRLAREEGMVTMLEDGIRKVERGLTTIEEVFRVIRE
jgi:type IV pilus assembly protein PilB